MDRMRTLLKLSKNPVVPLLSGCFYQKIAFGSMFVRVYGIFGVNFWEKNAPRSSRLVLSVPPPVPTGLRRGAVHMYFPVRRELKPSTPWWKNNLSSVHMYFPVRRELKPSTANLVFFTINFVHMYFPVRRELKQGHFSTSSTFFFCSHVLSRS